MKVLLIIIAIVLILVVAFSIALLCYVIYPKKYSMQETYDIEKSKGFLDGIEAISETELDIPSYDGYILHGTFWENDSNKYAIVTHGYTYSRWGSVKYAKIFYDLGYNVYFYDIRHHGMNKSCYCSLGYKEGKDVAAVVKFFQEKYGSDIEIGLHGESLGAASTLLSLQYCSNIAFAVCDCPFSDLGRLLEDLGKQLLHIPAPFTHLASYASLILKGFRLDRIKPIEGAKKSTVPLLLVHGKDDDFIYPMHSQNVYDIYKGYKEIYFYDKSKHAQSYEFHSEEYIKMVGDFLKNIEKLKQD